MIYYMKNYYLIANAMLAVSIVLSIYIKVVFIYVYNFTDILNHHSWIHRHICHLAVAQQNSYIISIGGYQQCVYAMYELCE